MYKSSTLSVLTKADESRAKTLQKPTGGWSV